MPALANLTDLARRLHSDAVARTTTLANQSHKAFLDETSSSQTSHLPFESGTAQSKTRKSENLTQSADSRSTAGPLEPPEICVGQLELHQRSAPRATAEGQEHLTRLVTFRVRDDDPVKTLYALVWLSLRTSKLNTAVSADYCHLCPVSGLPYLVRNSDTHLDGVEQCSNLACSAAACCPSKTTSPSSSQVSLYG